MDAPDGYPSDRIIDRAVRHLQAHYLEGSDPGICMACEGDPGLSELMNFGISCILPVVSQKDALGKSSAADRTKGNRRNEKFYRFAAFRRTGGEPLLVLPCCISVMTWLSVFLTSGKAGPVEHSCYNLS